MRTSFLKFLLLPLLVIAWSGAVESKSLPAPLNQEEYQDADDWFQIGLTLNADGKYQDAAEAFSRSIDINPENPVAWLNMGTAHALSGNFPEGISALRKAVQLEPNLPLAYSNLGEIYFKTERFKEAGDAFTSLLTYWPNDPNAHYKLGLCYLLQGDAGKAQAEYLSLKILDPDLADKLLQGIKQGPTHN